VRLVLFFILISYPISLSPIVTQTEIITTLINTDFTNTLSQRIIIHLVFIFEFHSNLFILKQKH